MTMRLTAEQAAIIGAYTGIACGPFSDVQNLAEKLLGRPILTHEFGEKKIWKALKIVSKPLFLNICNEG